MLKRFLWLLPVMVALWLATPLAASALGVNPEELNFRVDPGHQCTKTMSIVNDGNEAATYQIYVDEEHADWFTIRLSQITLEPQQSGELEITVSPPLTTFGEHTAFVYISPVEPSSGFQVALGIKLTANIEVDVGGYLMDILEDNFPYIIIGVLVVIAIIFFILAVVRPRRRGY